jgi:MFS family permease
LLVAAYTATFAAGQPAGGGLADRWGRLRTIAVGHGLSFLSLVPVLVVRHPLTLFGAAVGLGLGTALVSPSAEVLSGELVAPTLTATSMGLWRFFRDLGSFLGPVVLGAVWSQFGPQAALATALGTVVLAQAGASRLRTPAATGL